MYNVCIHQINKLVKGKFNQQYFGHWTSFLVGLFCFLNSPKLFQIEVLRNPNLRFMQQYSVYKEPRPHTVATIGFTLGSCSWLMVNINYNSSSYPI